jgi:ribulose-5-phosphate 4-epimerase/fuculose-1-phosphate aldolase
MRAELVEAAHVLSCLGLVTAYGHVSARATTSMLITPAKDLALVSESEIVEVPLDCPALPRGAPPESWIHLAVYRLRPDAHSIARAQPTSALAAAAVSATVVPLHGQAAWLGESVPVHDSAHLLRSAGLAEGAAAALRTGEALLLRGNGALAIGATPGIAAARMWLLSRTCEVWLAARSAGAVNALTAVEIASWRAVQEELLPRLWQHLRRRCRNRSWSVQEQAGESLP